MKLIQLFTSDDHLEAAIKHVRLAMIAESDNKERARKLATEMKSLIELRTCEQVERMEKSAGLLNRARG